MPDKRQQITEKEMGDAIQRSGYLMEQRAAQVLEEYSFEVFPNWFFPPFGDAGKMNEIDAMARRSECICGDDWSKVSAVVLVECKNNSQPVAFFMDRQRSHDANTSRILYDGFPHGNIPPNDEDLLGILESQRWHHYCREREIATQLCSFTWSAGEKDWKAEPFAHYSQSFSTLCLGTIFGREDAFALDSRNIELEFYYPIVVFQGPIFAVHVDGAKFGIESVNQIQLHHSVAAGARIVRAQIDVVREAEFPRLLLRISEELKVVQGHLQRSFEKLLAAANAQRDYLKELQMRSGLSNITHRRYLL